VKVVLGLRNPEAQYAGTRHNVGAEVVEVLADRWGERIKRGPMRVPADVAVSNRAGERIVLALLRANMNVSGLPTTSVLKYYKASPEDLLVIHDDIDLAFARLRLQVGRGPGGNNGVKSIMGALKTRDFWRLKVGVGRPPGSMDPAAFVLRRFSKAEREEVDLLVQDAADVVEQFFTDTEAAAQLAGRRRPPE
jgi:PTH1 family peptidyl-tRNA hydrolase